MSGHSGNARAIPDLARTTACIGAAPLPGNNNDVGSVAFSPDGKVLANGDVGGKVRLWDLATRKEIGNPITSSKLGYNVSSLAFSPDGKILASVTGDSMLRLWKVTTQQEIGLPIAVGGGFDVVAFSPDGKILAVGAGENVKLWSVADRQQIGNALISTRNPIDTVRSVAFSPDGMILAVSSDDGTVRLWDVVTRQPIGNPLTGTNPPGDSVRSVAFGPDGKVLAVAGDNDTVHLWDVAYLQDVVRRLCAAAGAPLTRAEWRQYVSGLGYQNICP